MGQGQGRLIDGRYRLIEVVGRGGMGTVWRAHDEVLDREVAIKEVLLPPGLGAADRDVLYQRTFREARTSARLNHPGVVTVHDVVKEADRPWLVMEFVRARSLQDIVDQEGPLPPGRVAEIGQQVLAALAHAHAAGILHRDVKPSNVLITDSGRTVLTDFGIAQMIGDVTLTQAGLVMGSPAYIAPERAAGERAVPASDLWALGATLYTAVEGRSPYERGDAIAAMAAALIEDPAPPRRAGRLAPVLVGLLARDPTRRMSADDALALLADAAVAPAEPYQDEAQVDQTQMDKTLINDARTPRFDPSVLETVNDPVGLQGATLLEGEVPTLQAPPGSHTMGPYGAGPYGPGPHPYSSSQLSSYGDDWRSGPTAESSGARGQGPRRRSRAFLLGGIAFVVGVALVTVGVLVWPKLMTGADSSHGGGGGQSGSQSAEPAPAGYSRVSGSGFSLAVPTGWKQSQDKASTYWQAPDGATFVQVNAAPWTGTPNAQAYKTEVIAKQRTDLFPSYAQIRIENVTYRGTEATDWEFTFTDPDINQKIRAKDRFVRFNGRAYTIHFRTPDSKWPSAGSRIDILYRTFQPTG